MSHRPVGAMNYLDRSPETDGIVDLGAREFPRIAELQPGLRILMLPAVLDGLHEQSVIVADAVAVGGDRKCCHALHETGGEPSEAAIAEGCVWFDLTEPVEIDIETGERGAHRLGEAKIRQ